jgi:hypothetical protein
MVPIVQCSLRWVPTSGYSLARVHLLTACVVAWAARLAA